MSPTSAAHFVGYYYVSPWEPRGRYLLAHAADIGARMPVAGEVAGIELIDTRTGTAERVAETRAWNWQAGSGLQWLPGSDGATFVFNDLRDGHFRAVLQDRSSGRQRLLPRPLSGLSPDGRWGVGIDFARLAQTRPVLGYAGGGTVDPAELPDDDGLWLVDLHNGTEELLVSLRAAVELREGPDYATAAAPPAYIGRPGYEQPARGHRLSGGLFAPDGRSLLCSHHWPRRQPLELPHFQRHVWDRKLLIDLATRRVRPLGADGFYSHHVWTDDRELLVWGDLDQGIGLWRWDSREERPPEPVFTDLVTADPHASWSPDGRLLLGDGYPDAGGRRPLWLLDRIARRRFDIGRFLSPPPFDKGPVRCDLHPRWRPDGRAVCIDSTHEGDRQVYEIDIGPVLAALQDPA